MSVDGPMWERIKDQVEKSAKNQEKKSAKGQQNPLIQAISRLGKLRQMKEKLVLKVVDRKLNPDGKRYLWSDVQEGNWGVEGDDSGGDTDSSED